MQDASEISLLLLLGVRVPRGPRPRPHRRHPEKWVLGGAAVLVAGAWLASLWVSAAVSGFGLGVWICDGELLMSTWSHHWGAWCALTVDVLGSEPSYGLVWPGYRLMLVPGRWGFIMPLWLPLLIFTALAIWLFRIDRSAAATNLCNCGYNLTGNTSGTCPECGQSTTPN